MQAILKISGIAVIGVTASMLIKDRHRNLAVAAVCCAALLICAFSIKNGILDTVEAVKGFYSAGALSQYGKTMLKALGIGYVTVITENICKDAGEGGLAFFVELGGRAQLMLLALPLISSLLDIASQLL